MNHFTTDDRYFAKYYTKYGVIPTDEELPYKASENSASGKYVHPDEDNNKGKSNKHMKQKQNKQTIKLNESQLRNIIKESVQSVLRENYEEYSPVWDMIEDMKQYISVEDILARLISKIGPDAAVRHLQDIKTVEIDPYI